MNDNLNGPAPREQMSSTLNDELKEYISLIKSKGLCQRHIQMISHYLLFAEQTLNLQDDDKDYVSAQRIKDLAESWTQMRLSSIRRQNFNDDVNTMSSNFVGEVIRWLTHIDRLDPILLDKNLIFNKLTDRPMQRLKYICYPLFEERLSYLCYMEDRGQISAIIKRYALYQLYVIDLLNLTSLRDVSRDEIETKVERWSRDVRCLSNCDILCSFAEKWLKYHNTLLLEPVNQADNVQIYNPEYFLDKYSTIEDGRLYSYGKWMLKTKWLSRSTVIVSMRILNRFSTYIHSENKEFTSLDLNCIEMYITMLYNRGSSRRNIASIISVLKSFLHFSYLERWGDVDLSLLIKAPKIFKQDTLPSAPSWSDVQRLIAYYDGDAPIQIRNRAIMILFAVYGIRSSELRDMRTKDINWMDEQIYLYRAKGCRSQIFPLLPIVSDVLLRYITTVRRNDIGIEVLFLKLNYPYTKMPDSAIYKVVADSYCALEIKPKHIGPHSLRHACASHLINVGHTMKEVSDLLGHKSLDTTRIYAKLDMTSLKKVAQMNWEGLL